MKYNIKKRIKLSITFFHSIFLLENVGKALENYENSLRGYMVTK